MEAPSRHPIFEAILRGDPAEVGRLAAEPSALLARADLGERYGSFFMSITPLIFASMGAGELAEVVRVLLEAGADPKEKSDAEGGPVFYAAGGPWPTDPAAMSPKIPSDFEARLRLLLKAGGDANEVTCNGGNPLAEAAGSGDPARVRLLLESGASPHPPESAFGKDDYEDEAALLADWGDDTPQMLAELRERLASSPPGYLWFAIPLFEAAEGGSAESVRLLLEAGASIDLRDRDGRSALDHAANTGVARVLLAAGLVPDNRQTWLDALDDRKFGLAEALLEGGLNPNGVEKSWSLLHHTALGRHREGVHLLARYGADLTFRTSEGQSPLHGAAWRGDGMMRTDVEQNEATIRALVELGFDVNERDVNGQTPLHEAAYGDWGSPTAIRTLLELGALPDPVDHNGVTPLMQAAYHGEEECVRLLLEAGADPRRPANDGITALGVAEEHVRVWRGLSEKAVAARDQEDIQMAEEALGKAERSLSALRSH